MPFLSRLHAPWRRAGFVASVGTIVLGCSSGDVAAPKPAQDPSLLYWALTLDHHAVNLSTAAPYDTLQLVATPRTATGEGLLDTGTVVYSTSDLSTVRVSPDGLVQAIAPGAGVMVIASLTLAGLTHADTAMVNVTSNPNPPVLASLSIHPVPPDSAKRAAALFGNGYPWQVLTTDTSGNPIPDLAVNCTSSDATVASVPASCGFIQSWRPGHVILTASTTAYGITKADTLAFTVGLVDAAIAFLQPDKPLGTITIAKGGTVQWLNELGQPADITFDDTTNVAADPSCQCGSGNIPPFDDARSRLFPVPGTYTYQSSAIHGGGTVVVANDP